MHVVEFLRLYTYQRTQNGWNLLNGKFVVYTGLRNMKQLLACRCPEEGRVCDSLVIHMAWASEADSFTDILCLVLLKQM